MNEIKQAIDELKQQLHNSEDCLVNGTTCELAIEALEENDKLKVEIERLYDLSGVPIAISDRRNLKDVFTQADKIRSMSDE